MQLARGSTTAGAPRGLRRPAAGHAPRRIAVHSSSSSTSSARVLSPDTARAAEEQAWNALKDLTVYRSSDAAPVTLGSLWRDDERAVLAFARSFGCFFCWELAVQLRRDVQPELDSRGVKLYLVSIGTPERSVDFARETGFPRDRLLADPDGVTYKALGLLKDVGVTFFNINTPLAFKKRMDEGRMGDLQDILPRWKPWHPPQRDQALQQGGMFVFQGKQLLFSHRDPATGAHADLQQVLGLATAGLAQGDCGCGPVPQAP